MIELAASDRGDAALNQGFAHFFAEEREFKWAGVGDGRSLTLDKKEPVAAPGDVAGDGAVTRDFDFDVLMSPVAGDIGDADFVAIELGAHYADGRVDARCRAAEASHVAQGCNQADGAMDAHAKGAAVVEEDDTDIAVRFVGFDQEAADHRVMSAGF